MLPTRSSSYKLKHMELDNNIYKARVSRQMKKRVFLTIMTFTFYKKPDLTDITMLQSLTL